MIFFRPARSSAQPRRKAGDRTPRLGILLLILLGLAGPAHAADDEGKPKPPPTKKTQTLSQKVYKQMEVAQQAFDEKNYPAAEQALNGLKAQQDSLNGYEKATLYNLFAAVYYAQDKVDQTIEAYKTVLRVEDLPEGLRNSTLYSLAQMYFVKEDYPTAVKILRSWMGQVEDVSPDAYVLLAQAYYQQGRYAESEEPIITAMKIAKQRGNQYKESWLSLLRAVYYEQEKYEPAAKVLEVLVVLYSKPTYWLQLSGMYGLMGDQLKQAEIMHAAYVAGMVDKPAEVLNVARLYMAQDAPYPATQVLEAAFKNRRIDVNAETLQLYAQALGLAKDYEKQLPVLEKLAEVKNDATSYVYLGQAHIALGHWDEAVTAFRAALNKPGVDNVVSLKMQLGTALYNAGELKTARSTFASVADDPEQGDQAANWVKFVSAEIQRKQALQGT